MHELQTMIAKLKRWGVGNAGALELKGALRYVFFVYSEFALVALLTLYFINTASPDILAESSITFIMISYSVFLAFGFHNGVTRDGAIAESLEQRNEILRLELLFSSAVAILLWGGALVFNPGFYLKVGMMIGGANHLKAACQAVFRLNGENSRLNLLNVSCALMFLFLFGASQGFGWSLPLEQKFFVAWLVATTSVVTVFFVACGVKVDLFSRRPYDANLFLKILKASKFMFVMAVGGVILLTSDRVMLNFYQVEESVIAKFQYVDTLSNIYFLGLSAILYYFTPNLLRRYKDSKGSSVAHFFRSMKLIAVVLMCMCLGFFVCASALLYVLDRLDYSIVELLLSMLLMKTSLIMLSTLCNFYLANGNEKYLAKYYVFVALISLLLTCFWVSTFSNSQAIMFLPLSNCVLVIALFSVLLLRIEAK